MAFDLEDERPIGGNLLRKKPGGASAARILSYRDYTGLEMMRVPREAVDLDRGMRSGTAAAVQTAVRDDAALRGPRSTTSRWPARAGAVPVP